MRQCTLMDQFELIVFSKQSKASGGLFKVLASMESYIVREQELQIVPPCCISNHNSTTDYCCKIHFLVNVRRRETSDGRFSVMKMNLRRYAEIWREVIGDESARGKIRRMAASRYVLKLLIGIVRRSKKIEVHKVRLRSNDWPTCQASATTTVKSKSQRQEKKRLPCGESSLHAWISASLQALLKSVVIINKGASLLLFALPNWIIYIKSLRLSWIQLHYTKHNIQFEWTSCR